MYEMCTGKLPFVGNSVVEIAMHHMEGNVIAPKDMYGDISNRLNLIILKAMNRRMDDRYQSMGELLQDLRLCIKNPDGTTLKNNREDAAGKTMVFTKKQVDQITKHADKKKTKSGKKKKSTEPVKASSKKNTQKKKRRQDDYLREDYDRDMEDEYGYEEEDEDVAAGLQKALNIGLIIVILIVVLFVLEFVFTSLGMFKGISQYLPSMDNMSEWLSRFFDKLNSMNIGKYLKDGFSRIIEIFRK